MLYNLQQLCNVATLQSRYYLLFTEQKIETQEVTLSPKQAVEPGLEPKLLSPKPLPFPTYYADFIGITERKVLINRKIKCGLLDWAPGTLETQVLNEIKIMQLERSFEIQDRMNEPTPGDVAPDFLKVTLNHI